MRLNNCMVRSLNVWYSWEDRVMAQAIYQINVRGNREWSHWIEASTVIIFTYSVNCSKGSKNYSLGRVCTQDTKQKYSDSVTKRYTYKALQSLTMSEVAEKKIISCCNRNLLYQLFCLHKLLALGDTSDLMSRIISNNKWELVLSLSNSHLKMQKMHRQNLHLHTNAEGLETL